MREHLLSAKLRDAFIEFLDEKFKNNEIDFEQFVDAAKSIKNAWNAPCLYKLLDKYELFENLIENNRLNADDLRYLLNTIDNAYELDKLCDTAPLIGYILNEFILNKETADRFNAIIENNGWCKEHNIHTAFELIEYRNNSWIGCNPEILKLNELNRYVCSFDLTNDQKLELYEVLKDNEIALNKLQNIVVNKLESNYGFESLMNYLKKKEKKNILNI